MSSFEIEKLIEFGYFQFSNSHIIKLQPENKALISKNHPQVNNTWTKYPVLHEKIRVSSCSGHSHFKAAVTPTSTARVSLVMPQDSKHSSLSPLHWRSKLERPRPLATPTLFLLRLRVCRPLQQLLVPSVGASSPASISKPYRYHRLNFNTIISHY